MSLAKTHEVYSHLWDTPPEWLRWVESSFEQATGLGRYFDPCPSGWEGGFNGLTVPWGKGRQSCYVNHPGERGSAEVWWRKYIEERRAYGAFPFIWCGFSIEQLRHMRPMPLRLDGWLVLPRERFGYVWRGATIEEKRDKRGKLVRKAREHGSRASSPSNWSFFWSTVRPASPPMECEIERTRGW